MSPAYEPPYGIILKGLLKKRSVIPVLGAGASLVGRAGPWRIGDASSPPTGRELSRYLADECQYPSHQDNKREELAKVCSFYEDVGGRGDLRDTLRSVFACKYTSNPIHRFLASLDVPLVAVTTNYDNLLEDAFDAVGRPYDVVMYPADGRKEERNAAHWWKYPNLKGPPLKVHPNSLDIDLATTTVVYKMHGSVRADTDEWDSYVITEEDYLDFMSRMIEGTAVPQIFSAHFRKRSFLFLGYSLQDWNMRVMLRHIGHSLRTAKGDESIVPSWAIQLHVEDDEERLWANRNVKLFEMDLMEFVTRMRERLENEA